MKDSPAKEDKNHDSAPENPLILPSAPFHHPNGVSTDAQGIGDAI